ncbi:MAG: GlsB/YeaQ/YmgE family stress response membrane protein [Chloroflexi bacterium]|nr:GlsB/YeaQ/YmgE family stress response membrane protein [Chloroflexota bacterium]
MPVLGIIGWIVIGFLAGALSGMVVGDRTARGCLPNILIGILGGLVGGFLAREFFGQEQIYGWIGSFVVAFVGAVIIRWVLGLAARPRDGRRY